MADKVSHGPGQQLVASVHVNCFTTKVVCIDDVVLEKFSDLLCPSF